MSYSLFQCLTASPPFDGSSPPLRPATVLLFPRIPQNSAAPPPGDRRLMPRVAPAFPSLRRWLQAAALLLLSAALPWAVRAASDDAAPDPSELFSASGATPAPTVPYAAPTAIIG